LKFRDEYIPDQIRKHNASCKLIEACENVDANALLEALKEGADLNTTTSRGDTALHLTVRNKFYYGLDKLIEKGADINVKNAANQTPLLLSIYNMRLDKSSAEKLTMQHLLNNGADPNLSDIEGRTPLMVATAYNGIKVMQTLLEHGADINKITLESLTGRRETALTISADYGHTDTMRFLILHGASLTDLSRRDKVYYSDIIKDALAERKQTTKKKIENKPTQKRGWYKRKMGHGH